MNMNKNDIIAKLSQNNSTLLSFPDRGPWGENSYRGNCSGWIQAFLIWKYKVKKLAELFAGSGTGSDVAKDMGIDYIGADLNPNPKRSNILVCDAIKDEVPDQFRDADFLFMHPPYSSLINIDWAGKAWDDPTGELAKSDLGNFPWKEFMHELNQIILKYYMAMPNNSKMAVLMGDVRRQGRCYSMFSDIVKPGQLEQVIIKAQHNCVSDGRKYANANFVPIVHETLMVIKKIETLMISYNIPIEAQVDIRDVVKSATWEDVVMAVIHDVKTTDLNTIYRKLENHKKAKANPNFKAKIRQTLQRLRDAGLVINTARGVWQAA